MIKKENLNFIERAVSEPAVVEIVQNVSESIWHRLPDVTVFEHFCYVEIGKAIAHGNISSIEGFAGYIARRAAARHLKRTGYESPKMFSEMASENREDEEEVEYEPIDVLADVESEVINKETVTLLAEGDCRRKKVLEGWALGNTNDSQISRSLARSFGGNADSHRKFVQRFRTSCQDKLRATAV